MNGYHDYTPWVPKIKDVDTRFKAYILNNISDVPMYYIRLVGDDHKYSGQEVKIISLMPGQQLGILIANSELFTLCYTSRADQRIKIELKDDNILIDHSYYVSSKDDTVVNNEGVFPFNSSNFMKKWE